MAEQKKTLIIGASVNPERYSNICLLTLRKRNIPVVAVGLREGTVDGVTIRTGMPHFDDIHTVTLYLGPQNQPPFYSYILSLKPNRVIFNPGTENGELEQLLARAGIETETACTIVMAQTGQF